MRVRLGVEMNNMARQVRVHLLVNPAGGQLAYDQVSSQDKTLKRYAGMRHEILNEVEKAVVLTDIVDWLNAHV